MPVALRDRPRAVVPASVVPASVVPASVVPASNDNGLFAGTRREAAFDGFWAAVRQAAGQGMRLDYLAPGVLRVAAGRALSARSWPIA